MRIAANDISYRELNEKIRESKDREIVVDSCMGQRYIGCGLSDKEITVYGIPGNALGAYLNGARLFVNGNAQDAVGDTMNEGTICIRGSCGDAAGYAMRGGKILIRGNAGYRAGIHMKAYADKYPVLVIGGAAGSFLGEYQAGGLIIVLGIGCGERPPVGYFCGTGMHGGRIVLRSSHLPADLPPQVSAYPAGTEDLLGIAPYVEEYCREFDTDAGEIFSGRFFVLTPNTKNPYKQLYAVY